MITVDNNRLGAITKIIISITGAQSYDAVHNDFRNSTNFSLVRIHRPDIVQPSESTQRTWLVRKLKLDTPANLLAGDSSQQLIWPQNDKSEFQRWRLAIAVNAETVASQPNERTMPLRVVAFNVIVIWNSTTNEFFLEKT